MEIKGAAYLLTLAQLMVTFAGFAALLMIFRQAAGKRLSPVDNFITRITVGHQIVLMIGALSPSLVAAFGATDDFVWRISTLLYAIPMLVLLTTYPWRRRRAAGRYPPPLILVVLVGANVVALIGLLEFVFSASDLKAAMYLGVLTFVFFSHAFSFVFGLQVVLRES